jgi:succinyldiaminopimelate transaminase
VNPRSPVTGRLPAFPWDALTEARARAEAHADGIVDLSIGTPVDATPDVVQRALVAAADAPGYPTVWGTPALRAAIVDYLVGRCGAAGLDETHVLPTVGSKEMVAALPAQLGIGPGDVVQIPELAYPTYAIGAVMAGADVIASDATVAAGPGRVALLWVNSPSNPTGRILGIEHLRKVVAWARERDIVVASDECYLEFGWDAEPVSVLDPRVNDGSFDNLLAVHSLSKRSNLAGYRAGFVAGDDRLVGELREVRKQVGLMVAAPVQQAMVAALGDDDHVRVQRDRYLRRRGVLRLALESAGFQVEHSEGALYLWATQGEASEHSVDWLAQYGILAAPGRMYGARGARHVRLALTATDERIAAAAQRLDERADRRL